MKKITLLFLLTSFLGYAQNTVTVEVGASPGNYLGYMNVFATAADGGAYQFGSGWGLADVVAEIGASTVTLKPNVNAYADNPGDAYWRNNGGAGPDGNKIMEAITYIEPGASFNNVDLTFTGEITSNTLDVRYTTQAFIKTVGGTNFYRTVDLSSTGVFTVSATAAEIATGTVQYGFVVTGLNANPADDWGNVVAEPVVLGINEFETISFNAYPNPSNDIWNIKMVNTQIKSVELYDITGKIILDKKVDALETSIDATNLNSGLYLAKINSDNATKTIKLIKR